MVTKNEEPGSVLHTTDISPNRTKQDASTCKKTCKSIVKCAVRVWERTSRPVRDVFCSTLRIVAENKQKMI